MISADTLVTLRQLGFRLRIERGSVVVEGPCPASEASAREWVAEHEPEVRALVEAERLAATDQTLVLDYRRPRAAP